MKQDGAQGACTAPAVVGEETASKGTARERRLQAKISVGKHFSWAMGQLEETASHHTAAPIWRDHGAAVKLMADMAALVAKGTELLTKLREAIGEPSAVAAAPVPAMSGTHWPMDGEPGCGHAASTDP